MIKRNQLFRFVLILTILLTMEDRFLWAQTTPGEGGGGKGPLPEGSSPGKGPDQPGGTGHCPSLDQLGSRELSPGLELPPVKGNASSDGTQTKPPGENAGPASRSAPSRCSPEAPAGAAPGGGGIAGSGNPTGTPSGPSGVESAPGK